MVMMMMMVMMGMGKGGGAVDGGSRTGREDSIAALPRNPYPRFLSERDAMSSCGSVCRESFPFKVTSLWLALLREDTVVQTKATLKSVRTRVKHVLVYS